MRRGVILVILFFLLYFLREFLQGEFLQLCGYFYKFFSPSKISQLSKLKEIENLKLQELERENERLREILKLKKKFSRAIVARVIGRSREEITDELIIEAGRNEGVSKNSAVVNLLGLIGVVEFVARDFSKVITYSDPRFQISARVARNREVGFLVGRGRGKNLELLYLSLNTDSRAGDYVLTSGEGLLPKGIAVGEIKEVYVHSSQLYKIAEVVPFADLNKVEEVLILGKKDEI